MGHPNPNQTTIRRCKSKVRITSHKKKHPILNNLTDVVLEIGALYDPKLLPDYQGDLFQHKFAKLVQQDIKDTNEELVAPWHMQEKLRPGTVVVVDTTLVCWHITGRGSSKSRKVCKISLN